MSERSIGVGGGVLRRRRRLSLEVKVEGEGGEPFDPGPLLGSPFWAGKQKLLAQNPRLSPFSVFTEAILSDDHPVQG